MKKNVLIFICCLIIIWLVIILNNSVITQRETKNSSSIVKESVSEEINSSGPIKDEVENSVNLVLVPEFRIPDKAVNAKFNDNSIKNFPTTISEKQKDYMSIPKTQEEYSSLNPVWQNSRNKPVYNEFNEKVATDNQMMKKEREKKYQSKVLMCKPYKESLLTEYMGMKMKYTVDIPGWIDNKCVLNFQADILDAGLSFKDTYGYSFEMAEVFGFAPKIRCEFTKQQLQYVGDSILEENKSDRNMLKNPEEIEFPDFKDLSFSDIKLLQIILNDKACKILNTDDFTKMFQGLFEF